MNKIKFNYNTKEEVKFHEVDVLGVCNNAVYLNYFEDSRLKYLKNLKRKYKFKEFLNDDSFVIMARNEIDYIKSAHLYDKLIVFTKIDKVSKSSFTFEHLVQRVNDGKEIAKGRGILVHINKKTMKSCPLPEEFHIAVLDYERV